MGRLYYEDLYMLANQDIAVNFLMSKVMSSLHLICVENARLSGSFNLGIGFPQYSKEKKSLGAVIRLYSEDSSLLAKTASDNRLRRLEDYIKINEVKEAPESPLGYKQYRRVQFKENKERLMRRYAKRHQTDIQQAKKDYAGFTPVKNNLPYIVLDSLSSGHRFRLYIEEVQLKEDAGDPVFNSYGLTSSGSLPAF